MNFVNQAQIPKTSIIKKPLKLNHIKPISRIQQIHKSNCSELRNQIKNYQSQCQNIILFGPAGSGKSSLIQTFNQALNQGKRKLENLCIQDLLHNEGTLQYQYFTIQDKQETVIKTNNKILKLLKTQINIIDTRGQILLNQKESKQIEVMLEGKVKDQILVQQRDHRYAHMLWEFWKQDTELFPLEIFNTQPNQPNQVIFVFDGSLDQIPNGIEEIEFYREIIQLVRSRGYQNPFIVLTSLDKLEKKISQMPNEKSIQIIDNRIQSIVKNLHIPRKHVFFLENYHGQVQDDQIDYYSLKLLLECLRSQKQNIDNECNIF